MSYSDFDGVLRFGDIVKGYINSIPNISKPSIDLIYNHYKIEIEIPEYCVIMDPCCEIGFGSISLTPLIEIRHSWIDNPLLAKDIMSINKEVKVIDAIYPIPWNRLSNEEKRMYLEAEPRYQHTNYFIFDVHEDLPPFPITRPFRYEYEEDPETGLPFFNRINEEYTIDMNNYMIDFKNIFQLKCEKIIKDRLEEEIRESKILQLSIYQRTDMRNKLGSYFSTPPEEDA